VQVSQQVSSLAVVEHLTKPRHFGTAELNNLGDALVIRRQPADAQELFFENTLQARTIFPS